MKRKLAIGGVVVLAVAAGGVGIAQATSDDDGSDTPITGTDFDRASRAALQYTGEGEVTETEVGDEESLYEVEVTREDGSQVDVQLDEGFYVVGSEGDDGETDAGETD